MRSMFHFIINYLTCLDITYQGIQHMMTIDISTEIVCL